MARVGTRPRAGSTPTHGAQWKPRRVAGRRGHCPRTADARLADRLPVPVSRRAGLARIHPRARSNQYAGSAKRRWPGTSLTSQVGGRRIVNLILSGFLCGFVWEFLNYWSRAKWHYTVPIMENVKLFEMPLPGYFGFPAFALECFTMYVFVRALCRRVPGFSAAVLGSNGVRQSSAARDSQRTSGRVVISLLRRLNSRRALASMRRALRFPSHGTLDTTCVGVDRRTGHTAPAVDAGPSEAGDSTRRRAAHPPHRPAARGEWRD